MAKHATITRTQKEFLKALKRKFSEDKDKSVWTKTEKELKHVTLLPNEKY